MSRVTSSHVLTPISSSIPIQVNRTHAKLRLLTISLKSCEGCSSYDVITSWPDLTRPNFCHQKLRKGCPISYGKFQHDLPNGVASSSEKLMGGGGLHQPKITLLISSGGGGASTPPPDRARVNLRFPPGFEEGHFHWYSSGGTKILMNRTNTVRRKKNEDKQVVVFPLRIMSSNRSWSRCFWPKSELWDLKPKSAIYYRLRLCSGVAVNFW